MAKSNTIQRVSLEDPTSASHEYILCLCGNKVGLSGFDTCLPNGLVVEPLVDGPWDDVSILCLGCLGVINQDTLEIVYPEGVADLNKKYFATGEYQPYVNSK